MGYRVKLLERLTEKFESLPGIGYKSAERMAFYILSLPKEEAKDFAEAIIESSEKQVRCDMCGCFSEDEVCDICKDESRETSTICVVQSMKDVFAFERINEYHGLYHVLHGLISPMDGISPDDINIPKLLERVQKSEVGEIIMATGSTVEGEATAMYISRLLKPFGLKITKLAYGIPIGASLEYADDVTLAIALNSRREI